MCRCTNNDEGDGKLFVHLRCRSGVTSGVQILSTKRIGLVFAQPLLFHIPIPEPLKAFTLSVIRGQRWGRRERGRNPLFDEKISIFASCIPQECKSVGKLRFMSDYKDL